MLRNIVKISTLEMILQYFVLIIWLSAMYSLKCERSFGNKLLNPRLTRIQGRSRLSSYHLLTLSPSIQSSASISPLVSIDTDSKNSADRELLPNQKVYLLLAGFFVTSLIISNILDAKLFSFTLPLPVLGIESIDNTAGMLTFPFTFITGDIVNEFYGSQAAHFMVLTGMFMSIFAYVVINIGQVLPYLDRPFNISRESFDMVFGSSKSIFAASVVSYLVSSMIDIWIFKILKRLTKGKHLWLRAYGSTAISQLLDTTLMAYLAFSLSRKLTNQSAANLQEIWKLSVTGYSLKLLMAALLTPLLYYAKGVMLKQLEKESPQSSGRMKTLK